MLSLEDAFTAPELCPSLKRYSVCASEPSE